MKRLNAYVLLVAGGALAACSQETRTEAPKEPVPATQEQAPSAKVGRSPTAEPGKDGPNIAAAIAEAAATKKTVGDAYVQAREAYVSASEQVKLKMAEIAKAKEAGDSEAVSRLTAEFRELRSRQDETKAIFLSARTANDDATQKLKQLRQQAAGSSN